MATPDHVTEHFEDTTETVEVRGDFVVLTIETRFGEPLLENSMSVEEAINLATRLFDAAATIYRRQPTPEPSLVAEQPAEPTNPAPEADISGWADAAPKLAQ